VTDAGIEIRRASGSDLEQAIALRLAVFVGEQGVPESLERDGRDAGAVHLVAVESGRVVGTCRLLMPAPDPGARGAENGTARFGRLAVAPEHRRRGLGLALLAAAEEEARAAGVERIVLHAQTYAWRLYAAAGYRRRGEPFQQAGLEHITMELRIA
jgi:predicted GNAT family N-acyltransferase